MVRGVMFPYARGGIAAAMILGLGRALGEAIAVTQVVGGAVAMPVNFFEGGDTLASKLASGYQGAATALQTSSLIYLALILLVFSLAANLAAQWVVRASNRKHGITRGGHA
jgi:phosphate transport system permease protein